MYQHKKNPNNKISDSEFEKLSFGQKLSFRYLAGYPPDLGDSGVKATIHFPSRPDPDSYIESFPVDPNTPKHLLD